MALGVEHRVRPLAPDILVRSAGPRIGPRVDAVDRENAEGRHPVLAEVLILVVAPDQHEIGVESVERLATFAEAADQPLPVLLGGGERVGPLLAHRLGPARRVLQLGGNLIAVQRAVEQPGHLLVRLNKTGIMRDADTENVAHRATPLVRGGMRRRSPPLSLLYHVGWAERSETP